MTGPIFEATKFSACACAVLVEAITRRLAPSSSGLPKFDAFLVFHL